MRNLKTRYPRAWTFVAARFARGEYLGLHLTIGLAICLAALGLFAVITEDVIERERLVTLDLTVFDWLRRHGTPVGYRVFAGVSLLGSPPVVAVVAIAVGALLAARRAWIFLGGWVAALVGATVLDTGLKLAIRRPRPPGAEAFLTGSSWSFPSGHAMGSLVAYGMVAYLVIVFWAHRSRARRVVLAAALALIVAIGASRLYLGVHYVSDVIGGYAVGTLWLSACVSGLEVVRRGRAARLRPPAP